MATIDTVWKFLTNDKDYEPLRATVMGAGGTGKSYLINTICTMIKELTQSNETVKVAAPSGGAAYNIGGCTVHRLLGIDVGTPWMKMNDKKRKILHDKLKRLLVLIIDERSQLSNEVVGAAESHVRQCAFGGNNQSQAWGGIPVILLFGDDYQLPPTISPGAINGYAVRTHKSTSISRANGAKQIIVDEGRVQLTEALAQNVFELTIPFRQNQLELDNDSYIQLLHRVRQCKQTEEDSERVAALHWTALPDIDGFKSKIENDPKTTYLFANKEGRDNKNNEVLISSSKKNGMPVAKLRYVDVRHRKLSAKNTSSEKEDKEEDPDDNTKRPKIDINDFHWRSSRKIITPYSNMCVGATVAINGINFEPNWGLFNGARGTVVDIVYDKETGPHTSGKGRLPKYVVLDMPGFKPPPEPIGPWDRLNPTVSNVLCSNLNTIKSNTSNQISSQHVPIPMLTVECEHKCCAIKCCPLVLAWAMTIHRFQGFEAGPSIDDLVNHLLVDPGNMQFENMCLGVLYTALSRAKAIGMYKRGCPNYESCLYWIGANMSRDRVNSIGKKKNNEDCVKFTQREEWVHYLTTIKTKTTNKFNKDKIKQMKTTYNTIKHKKDMTIRQLTESIFNSIQSPNYVQKNSVIPFDM